MAVKGKKKYQEIQVDGIPIPVHVYFEARSNARISIGKKSVNLRLSMYFSKEERKEQAKELLSWVRKKFLDKSFIKDQWYDFRMYQDGDQLKVGQTTFNIKIRNHEGRLYKVEVHNENLLLWLPEDHDAKRDREMLSHLVAKGASIYFKPTVKKRLLELNDLHFNQKINRIVLKNNSSNWGSCSSKGNINISTRLMFAPARTIDYVLIHELAHLIVMDHSPKFWRVVEKAMPDYQVHEDWLKRYGNKCHF